MGLLLTLTCFFQPSMAQKAFGELCLGNWKGTMYLYGKGQLRDSVSVELSVQKQIAQINGPGKPVIFLRPCLL